MSHAKRRPSCLDLNVLYKVNAGDDSYDWMLQATVRWVKSDGFYYDEKDANTNKASQSLRQVSHVTKAVTSRNANVYHRNITSKRVANTLLMIRVLQSVRTDSMAKHFQVYDHLCLRIDITWQ